jgi:hypothetical protein
MSPEQMLDQLTDQVLARYQEELIEADAAQLVHLSQRAEARYNSNLGERMRALVDGEHERRAQRQIETSPLTNRYRSWVA